MKKTLLFLALGIAILLPVMAQRNASPAEDYVKILKGNLSALKKESQTDPGSDKAKSNLETGYKVLKSIKSKDPDYKTEKMEKELDEYAALYKTKTGKDHTVKEQRAAPVGTQQKTESNFSKLLSSSAEPKVSYEMKDGVFYYDGKKELTYTEEKKEDAVHYEFLNSAGQVIIKADKLKAIAPKYKMTFPTIKHNLEFMSISMKTPEKFIADMIKHDALKGDAIDLLNFKRYCYNNMYDLVPDDNSAALKKDPSLIKILNGDKNVYWGKIEKSGKIYNALDEYIGRLDVSGAKVYDANEKYLGRMNSYMQILDDNDKLWGQIGATNKYFSDRYDRSFGFYDKNLVIYTKPLGDGIVGGDEVGKLIAGFPVSDYHIGALIYYFRFFGIYVPERK